MKTSGPAKTTSSRAQPKEDALSPPLESRAVESKLLLSSGIGQSKTALKPFVIGNKKYELALRMEGKLGFFKDRKHCLNFELSLPLNELNYQKNIQNVIEHVLNDLACNKKDLSARHPNVSTTITNGILVMTYLKLRALNIFRPIEKDKFYSKPKVYESFEVPGPFGYAISQLGVVEVSSLPIRMICYPTATPKAAATFLLARKTDWSQTAYEEAVRYAKDLGMTFTKVDLSLKVGSSWWLFSPKVNIDVFSLRAVLPEDNYTLAGAVIYMLFVADATNGSASEIFNLAQITDADYGSFIRRPRQGFNLLAYYAISNKGTSS